MRQPLDDGCGTDTRKLKDVNTITTPALGLVVEGLWRVLKLMTRKTMNSLYATTPRVITRKTIHNYPPPPQSFMEPGMPIEEAIEIWRSRGAPVIHLGPGENRFDLKKMLTNHKIKPEHLEAVRDWLEKTIKQGGEA